MPSILPAPGVSQTNPKTIYSLRSFIRSRSRLGAGTRGVRLRVQAPCSDGDKDRPRLMNQEASLYSPDLLYTCDHMLHTVEAATVRALVPRIIAVADTFDALTTNRPYQQAHDPEAALRIIHSLSGKRLDPTAVAALTAIYKRGEIRIQAPTVALPAPPAPADSGQPSATTSSAPEARAAVAAAEGAGR